MASGMSAPVRHRAGRACLLVVAAAWAACGVLGGRPCAFFQTAAAGAGVPSPELVERSKARDSFFEGPAFLKVLYEPSYMDLSGARKGIFAGLRAFEEETNTKVKTSKVGDWCPHAGKMKKVVTISGETADILGAFSRLAFNFSEDNSVFFLFPAAAAGALIGLDGEAIQGMREKTLALIQLKKLPKFSEGILQVKGTAQAAKDVAAWLLDELANWRRDVDQDLTGTYMPAASDYQTEIYIALTNEQRGAIIGKGGRTIQRLRQEWFVDLQVDNEQDVLRLSGAIGDVHAIHQHIVHRFLSSSQDPA